VFLERRKQRPVFERDHREVELLFRVTRRALAREVAAQPVPPLRQAPEVPRSLGGRHFERLLGMLLGRLRGRLVGFAQPTVDSLLRDHDLRDLVRVHRRAELAVRHLGRIDVPGLSTDARAQYDIARRFVTQATEALTARNFEFAEQLAGKAATLAALLQRR